MRLTLPRATNDHFGALGWARLRMAGLALAIAAALAVPATAGAQPGMMGPDVKVRAVPQFVAAPAGQQLSVAVVLDHGPGFHTWPRQEDVVVPPELGAFFEPIPTVVELVADGLPAGTQVWPTQWPAPAKVTVNYTGTPLQLESYHETAVVHIPLSLPLQGLSDAVDVDIRVSYQACDETVCFPPETVTLRAPIRILAIGEAPVASDEAALFASFAAPFASPPQSAPGAPGATGAGPRAACSASDVVPMNLFGWRFSFNPCGAGGLGLLLLFAALGGLMLNLTPCVLPVIPLKVMGLSHAAGNPGRLKLLGASMALGVTAFWLAIGGAIAFIAGFSAISSLFQTPWFSLVVGVFVAVMALGMFGLFAATLPQSIYRFNPSHDTVHGSFLFGMLTAVLATPCTAPFMGTAAAWAATQAPAVTLSTFVAIGVGMSLPYLALALRPGLISAVPRSGPGSELVKQVMGILMLAVAAYFIGIPVAGWLQRPPDPASRAYWWLVALFVVLAMAWLAWRTWRLTTNTNRRLAVAVPAMLLAGAMLLVTDDLASYGPVAWTYYTPARFAEAEARGDVVVLDFTAEWCLNCKTLEAAVLHRPEVVALLEGDGVTPMKVDLTNGDANPDGQAKLAELGAVAIPLLAIFGPGTGYGAPSSNQWDNYTIDMVKQAIGEAGGAGGATP